MNIIEAMKQRRSVRTFSGTALTPAQKQALEKAVAEAAFPFGGSVAVRLRNFDLKAGYRPGTYGFIKGADTFFLLAMGPDDASALSAGYGFEQVVLKAWQLGLGTCWIAGTFKGSDFNDGQTWPAGLKLKVVCPVGTPATPSLTEKIARFAVGSKNRKSFDDLFFCGDFSTPVPTSNPFREALEMLRLAPSSTNSQPWRALVAGSTMVHFYYKPKSALSVLDTGIGICHFHETEKFHGHEGSFSVLEAPVPPHGWKYLVSYTRR